MLPRHSPLTSLLTLVLLAALVTASTPDRADAQRRRPVRSPRKTFAITPWASWQLGGSLTGVQDNEAGKFKITDGVAFGGVVGYSLQPNSWTELTYDYFGSSAQFRGSDVQDLGDVATHHLHIGGSLENPRGAVVPFFGGGLGLTIVDPKSQANSETRFSFHLKGGFRFPVGETVALEALARAWGITISSGGGVWCGLPGGCALSASGSILWQWDFGGGLSFRF